MIKQAQLFSQFLKCQTLQQFKYWQQSTMNIERQDPNLTVSQTIIITDKKSPCKEYEDKILHILKIHFPKLIERQFNETISNKLEKLILTDNFFYESFRKLVREYTTLSNNFGALNKKNLKQDIPIQKKLTRAALAKRDQKMQEQLRKDQIFVRLAPKSQACMQFMLANRNFPRMQCKLSCNQHIEYLINYLSEKWFQGKLGYKIVLYPDTTTYLKNFPLNQRQKVLYEPLNNFYMFTDLMIGCDVSQNGTLDLIYDIVEITTNRQKQKKNLSGRKRTIESYEQDDNQLKSIGSSKKIHCLSPKPKEKFGQSNTLHPQLPKYNILHMPSSESKSPQHLLKVPQTSHHNIVHQNSLFHQERNNFYEDSLFGSLGFNFKSIHNNEHAIAINYNSNSFAGGNFTQNKSRMLDPLSNVSQKSLVSESLNVDKLDHLRNAINALQKQEQMNAKQESRHLVNAQVVKLEIIKQQVSRKDVIQQQSEHFSIKKQQNNFQLSKHITKQVKTVPIVKKKINS